MNELNSRWVRKISLVGLNIVLFEKKPKHYVNLKRWHNLAWGFLLLDRMIWSNLHTTLAVLSKSHGSPLFAMVTGSGAGIYWNVQMESKVETDVFY